MTFQDIFKSDFLENMASVSVADMVIAMVLSLCLGLFIFLLYTKCYTGVMYSSSFGLTLIALVMITTLLIMTVVSNVVLSLGMVGALSIVRFRAAVKDPLEIAFLFWALADGIVLAAGLIPLAVFGSLFIGAVLFLLSRQKRVDTPYILVVHCRSAAGEEAARELIAARARRMSLKSKTVEPGLVELNYEVRLRDGESGFVHELAGLEEVSQVALVSYNGDYVG